MNPEFYSQKNIHNRASSFGTFIRFFNLHPDHVTTPPPSHYYKLTASALSMPWDGQKKETTLDPQSHVPSPEEIEDKRREVALRAIIILRKVGKVDGFSKEQWKLARKLIRTDAVTPNLDFRALLVDPFSHDKADDATFGFSVLFESEED